MSRTVPVHYLRRNEACWTPPAAICLDTETRQELDDGAEVHTLRVWVARMTDRRAPKNATPLDAWSDGGTGEELAHQVHAWCRGRRTVWLYAHNLHFDLCTSDLICQLGLLGWRVTDFAVDGQVPFVRLARGESHLVVADSWSWLPVPLTVVAGAVAVAKPPLPAEGDGMGAWLARCRADVAILSAAMLTLMSWWDANELGRWSITGGTSGWNVMRHLPSQRRILIDPDPGKVAADREAIYGGRRGQWRTGDLPPGRYLELDLERAYTVACRDLPLPCERLARFASLPLDHPWLRCDRYGVIARVLIETDVPRWPVRAGRRVWYPVGEFWTVLAGPDIAEAARLGCLRAVGAGYVHRLGYALRPWALWCLGAQADTTGATPPVVKITLKHWGRSVVGKWAQRGFTRVELGAAPTAGWWFGEGWNHTQDVRCSIVDFGGIRWQVSASADGDNTYPAVLAFVESYVRVTLGRVVAAIGDQLMVSCDTDGVLTGRVTPVTARRAREAAEPFTLREKAWYKRVTALGPQHAILDGRRRFAGVPASAAVKQDGTLTALLWPKLAWQMRHGRAGAYVRPGQDYTIGGTYAPGWVLLDGSVRAVETAVDADGGNRLLAWPQTRWALTGRSLGPVQNPSLGGYGGEQENGRGRKSQAGGAARRGSACR